jgi:uncharacterized membrane protein YeaQ/YmgE (transglycosylase-associated protein family)
MSLIELLVLLVIAGVCGAIGQAVTGLSRGGCLASIGLGLVGAVVGSTLARRVGLPELFSLRVGGAAFPFVWSILGASLLVVLFSWVSRKR